MATFSSKHIYVLLFLTLLSYTIQLDYCVIGNNTITINTYQSSLNHTQRNQSYYYWIGVRNDYYYSDATMLEKMVKYFTPEEENYYSNLFGFSVPLFICAGILVFFLLVYLVMRFLLKGCQGPKIIENSFVLQTKIILIFGGVVSIVFLITTTVYAAKSK